MSDDLVQRLRARVHGGYPDKTALIAADRIEALETALRSAVLELNRVTEAPNGWPHYTPADFPLPEDREALDV